jgi:hypothetical protein
MSYNDRQAVVEMDQDYNGGNDSDLDMDSTFTTLPPGDEGFDISHAGGEHEVFEGFADDLAARTGL